MELYAGGVIVPGRFHASNSLTPLYQLATNPTTAIVWMNEEIHENYQEISVRRHCFETKSYV